MEKELKILLLEDNADDAELVERELVKEKISFVMRRAETKEQFLQELENYNPDIILADYRLPSFSGLQALDMVLDRYAHIPFIIVSGTLGEEIAIDTMKSGATDYVLKDKLGRLSFSVKRAIKGMREKEDLLSTERELMEVSRLWSDCFNGINDGLEILDFDKKIIRCNREMERVLHKPFSEIIGVKCCSVIHGTDKPIENCSFERMKKNREKRSVRYRGR